MDILQVPCSLCGRLTRLALDGVPTCPLCVTDRILLKGGTLTPALAHYRDAFILWARQKARREREVGKG